MRRLPFRFWIAVLVTLSVTQVAAAQNWQRLGPEGGMVVSLGAATGGRLYLGTADGHVFASEDGAGRWEMRGRVSNRTDAVISRLVAGPRESNLVYAAVWYQEPGKGGGVFGSEDSGRTWSQLGLAEEEVRALEFASGRPDVLVAGTRSGVFRSRDAGRNWQRISPAGDAELQNVDSIAVDPGDANIIYAGTYHLPWKTTDGGRTWKSIATGLIDDSDIMSLRVDATNPSRVYLSACSGIYRSENRGGVWTKLQGIPYAARRTHQIVQDLRHPETLYAATSEGLWVTRDAGENWKRTTPKDWVITGVVVLAGDDGTLGKVVLGTEGQGILVSADAGESFLGANAGFRHLVVKQLVADTWQDPRHLLLWTEQGVERIWESRDAGMNWAPAELAAEGAGREFALHPEMMRKIYASPWGWLAKLNNGQIWLRDGTKEKWKEWKLAPAFRSAGPARGKRQGSRPVPGIALSLAGNAIAFSRDAFYFAAREGVMRCSPGAACARMKAFGRSGFVDAIWASSDGQLLGVVADGKLAISVNAGADGVWRELPAGITQVAWLDGYLHAGRLTLFLGTDNGLFESLDGGTRWMRRENGLPAGPMESWLRGDNFLMASLRQGGIYLSRDEGTSWTRLDEDAEKGRAAGLAEVEPGVVIVGSQREGLLQLDLRPGK
ncbi:MAG TPA: hypothetical protein VJY15_08875 [Candidatus Acidoferrum sp.]|nr:hypothetical protein [Candidatus Acidoferrum sp.]